MEVRTQRKKFQVMVFYKERGTFSFEKSFKLQVLVSINMCELAAIQHALSVIHKFKHIYKDIKIAPFTDNNTEISLVWVPSHVGLNGMKKLINLQKKAVFPANIYLLNSV